MKNEVPFFIETAQLMSDQRKINLGRQVFGDNFRFWGFSGSAQCLLADWWSLADLRVDEIKSGNPEKEDKM